MSVLSDSRRFSEKLPAVLQLRPYQQRWVDDRSRFKGAVKSARIGFSFATAAEAVLDCLEVPGTTWTVLSHSKPGSREFVEEGAGKIIKAINATARIYSEPFADELGMTDVLAHRIDFPNGSRIIALPADPRTARGYPGNAILDEFAHHEQSYSIWAAISRQVALGHKLRILSTPNGEQGKFFDLAKEFGLTDGLAPNPNPMQKERWSWHWVDVLMAIADGCPVRLEEVKQLYKGDDATLQQEFFCVFLKAIGAWLDFATIVAAEDSGAMLEFPAAFVPQGPLYLGVDFGRTGDRTCLWLDEQVGDVSWTRLVKWLHDVPFFSPKKIDQAREIEPWVRLANRSAMDCTGIGLGIFEYLAAQVPGRVMGVNFGGSITPEDKNQPQSMKGHAVKVKTDLAVRTKRRFEEHRNRIPHHLDIRQELQAIKRESSGNSVKFDAPRIEIDSPSGGKTKAFQHGEAFWAKALADFAAAGSSISVELHSAGMRAAAALLDREMYTRESCAAAARGF